MPSFAPANMSGSSIVGHGYFPPLLAGDICHIIDHTCGMWDGLRGKTILLTGGSGFLGTWLVESFCAANTAHRLGASMIVISREPERFRHRLPHLANRGDLLVMQGDITSLDLALARCDFVIHAAGETGLRREPVSDEVIYESLVTGTAGIAKLAAEMSVEAFLLLSSGAVYGDSQGSQIPWRESQPYAVTGRTAYMRGKLEAERLSRSLLGDRLRVARCFTVTGAHLPLDGRFAMGNFIGDALIRKSITLTGDGTAVRSYLYAADLAVWLWTILLRGSDGGVYNVGSGEGVSMHAVASAVARAAGLPQSSIHRGSGGASYYVPDVSRAKEELGLNALVGLEEGINRTIEWYRKIL